MTQARGSRIAGWTSANFIVVVFALFPVFWIVMLSLKDPSTIADGRLIPSKWSFESYKGIFKQAVFTDALRTWSGPALLASVVGVVPAWGPASALARLTFRGKPLILRGAPAIGLSPPISIVGPLYNMWRNLG